MHLGHAAGESSSIGVTIARIDLMQRIRFVYLTKLPVKEDQTGLL